MRYATLCSGIGAPEVAFGRLGWECVFQSEIEPFACAVLAYHWPSVPNRGDMTRWREWPAHNDLDLLVAGTPCQAFSVAGLRGSLDDVRGNLTLEFARYANHVRPRAILWENVPGVLNTKDNAFGCFLGPLAGADCELRPPSGRWTDAGLVSGPVRQIAWRVLDAQYRGLAQRRRRVFVLACDVARGVGDWACARALFPQSSGMCGYYPAGGEAGPEVAGTLGGGAQSRGWCDDALTSGSGGGRYDAQPMIAPPCTHKTHADRASTEGGLVTGTLSSKAAKGVGGPSGCECQNLVATFRGEGHDASEDGTGRGSPLALCVRRLLPVEFERLQGFHDGHTAIVYRGKPAKDGPRYRAIGNAMAVPVIEWMGRRIERFCGVTALGL